MTRLRERMLGDLWRRNYSPDTICGYIRAVQQSAQQFGRSSEQLGAERVRRYRIYLLHDKKLAFLYSAPRSGVILRSTISPFHKQPHSLPTVLSQDEVTHLIEMTRNRMHGTILMVLCHWSSH